MKDRGDDIGRSSRRDPAWIATQYRAAPSLDHPDAERPRPAQGSRAQCAPAGSSSSDPLHQARGFGGFIEAHVDPRRDIAVGAQALPG